ncbi:MAG: complex I subunit 1 family protein [Methanobacteriota archaeon]
MNWLLSLVYIFVFPGFLFVLGFSTVVEWIDRKGYARMQRRVGPPFIQPIADFIKLMAKEDIVPEQADSGMFSAVPVFALAAVLCAALYIPVVAMTSLFSFQGDLIMVLYLLTIPSLALFLAGWHSGNQFGQVGAMRVATQLFSYEVPFFLALLAPALMAGSWNMAEIIRFVSDNPLALFVTLLGFFVAVIALQGKLERLPFDIPDAETEIVGGPLTEYSGRRLALFRLLRDVEMVVGAGLLAAVFLGGPSAVFFDLSSLDPAILRWTVGFAIFLVKTLFVILLLILMKSVVARIRIDQMVKVSYKWLIQLGVVQILLVLVLRAMEVF